MKKIFFLVGVLILCLFDSKNEDGDNNDIYEFFDGIACRIITSNRVIPVYFSDIWLPSALGAIISLEERIIRLLWIAQGEEKGVKINNDASSLQYAEQYLNTLQEQKGITRDDLNKMAEASGYSLRNIKEDLNQQFLFQQSVEAILLASGAINVCTEEIESYYRDNPLFTPPYYNGAKILCPCDFHDEESHKKLNNNTEAFSFYQNYSKNDLTDDEEIEFKEKEVNFCSKDGQCYCVYIEKIKPENIIPLSERYIDIMNTLQKEKYVSSYRFYTKIFLESDMIFFKDDSLKKKCLDFLESQKI